MIVDLVNISINNAVVHYRGSWFAPIQGIPTGGSESGSIANIYVKWCLDQKILPSPTVCRYNNLSNRKRFLDDLWFLWKGSPRVFSMFLNAVNDVGREYGIVLKGEVNDIVNFLDVSTMLVGNRIRTCLFIKPTDATRYLHRKSDHSLHTFKSTPFSQFRRASVICSDPDDRDYFINNMMCKFVESGYKEDDLMCARAKALLIDRADVMNTADNAIRSRKKTESDSLTFVINHDRKGSAHVRSIVKENQEMINYLFGKEINIIVAERRSPNTSSLLFSKSGFANELFGPKCSQKCGARGCLTCNVMDVDRSVVVNGVQVKFDFSLNCGSDCIIYLYLCNHCEDSCKDGFYFGQTVNSMRERANGHRACFNKDSYMKSALAFHIWDKHREHFKHKMNNFREGVIKSVSPANLDRAEDYFVYATRADTMGLNRYKVLA